MESRIALEIHVDEDKEFYGELVCYDTERGDEVGCGQAGLSQ